jgi:hypothetical protein
MRVVIDHAMRTLHLSRNADSQVERVERGAGERWLYAGSKLGQICTNFEANVGKSARNRGIDHVEPGETASHVKYQHEIL